MGRWQAHGAKYTAPPMPEPIPIIGGTGALGWGLALRLARAGQQVVIGSRSAERAGEAVARLRQDAPGSEVEGLVNTDAARRGPIVFLTVPFRAQSENLNNLRDALEAGLDEDVLICGDRRADKARVARLLELIPGLRAINAGALETARLVEQLTPLLISINARYKTHAGVRITGLPHGDPWE